MVSLNGQSEEGGCRLVKLQYKVHEGTGPHLLLVHGFLSSPVQWALNLKALARVTTPVTVALYGHADSPSPTDAESYNPKNYVRQFEAIREKLAVDAWFVCGYSFGASLTMKYALDFPEKILGHIFTNSMSGFSDVSEKGSDPQAIVTRFDEGGIGAVEKIAVHPKNAKRLPPLLAESLLAESTRINAAGIGRSLAYTMPFSSSANRVVDNTCPSLLVHGMREKRFLDIRDELAKKMPHLEIVDLDAGHGVNMEQPEAFNEAVRKFVTKQLVNSPA